MHTHNHTDTHRHPSPQIKQTTTLSTQGMHRSYNTNTHMLAHGHICSHTERNTHTVYLVYKCSYPRVHSKPLMHKSSTVTRHTHTCALKHTCSGNHTHAVILTPKAIPIYKDTHKLRMSPHLSQCAEVQTQSHLAPTCSCTHILKLMHTCMFVYIPIHVPRHSSIHADTPKMYALILCICVPTLMRTHTPTQVCTLSMPILARLEPVITDYKAKSPPSSHW